MRSPSISLRTLLALVFASIILTVVGGLVWVTYRGMAALSTVEASARFDALASTVGQRLRTSFDPGLIMLDAVAAMPLGRMEPLAAAKVVLDIMRSGERRSSAVTAVQIGRPDGSAIIVVRVDEADHRATGRDYAAKLVEAGPDGLLQRVVGFDAEGRELSRTGTSPSDFDARNRPWYGAALETAEAITTRPYRYIGQRNVVGLTVARRSTTEAGIVFGIDVTIQRLSDTLTALRASSGADLFLFHPSGQLVASAGKPGDSPSEQELIDGLPSIEKSHNPLLTALYREYGQRDADKNFGKNLDLQVDGQHYLIRIDGDHPDTGLITVISLPRDVVLGPAAALRDEQFLIGLGAILAAFVVSLVAAGRLTQPLAAVTRVLSGISEFRFDAPRGRPSSIREIADLWSMVGLLEYTLRMFTCYVPSHLVRDIARNRRLPMVGGVRQEVTVLFTDVEGFTALSERADPQELMAQMSQYFGTIAAAVTASGGVVDKYIGDSVMAVWIASPASPDHVARACAATLEIAARIDRLNATFLREGRPVLRTRYGLNTGEGIVGHVGSVDRLSYTVLGHTVNLASRLEQQNKACGTTILASEAVVRAAGARFAFVPVGRIPIRGISSDIGIFELRRDVA